MGKNNNKKHRLEVYTKSKFKCVYCDRQFKIPKGWNKLRAIHDGEMYLEIDHVIPLSRGGSDLICNKQSLCQKCNNIKSNKIKED